jgi:hypothetical protein
VKPYVTWRGVVNPRANLSNLPAPLTPYQRALDPNDGTNDYLGTPDNVDHTATDNVHNHLLGKR